jgi:transcription-repair coupling factor (superfamily II helicase)
MEAFLEPLRGLKSFEELEKFFSKQTGIVAASGCIDTQKPHIMFGLNNGAGGRIIVTFDEQKARELLDAYRYFDSRAVYFPARDILFYQSDIRGNALTRERILAYRAVLEEEQPVIITTFDALMDRLVRPEVLRQAVLHLHIGDELDMEKMRLRLVHMGYENNYQAQEPGQFAVRGGILDIFPLTEEIPYRIELWGDEIDSMRSFSPESQRSLETLDELVIYPASELVLSGETLERGLMALTADADRLYESYRKEMKTQEAHRIRESVEFVKEQIEELGSIRAAESYLPYFYQDTVGFLDFFAHCAQEKEQKFFVFVDEPARCMESAGVVEQEFRDSMQQRLEKGYVLPGQAETLLSKETVTGALSRCRCVLMSSIEQRIEGLLAREDYYFQVRSVNSYNSSFELLTKDLKHYKKEKYSVILLCSSRTRAQRMAADLQEQELAAFFSENVDRIVMPGEIMVLYGKLKRGFEYPDVKFVVLTETDIFGGEKKKRKKKKIYDGERIASFSDLKPGDYVVHENHGLGIYRGIEKIEVDKTMKDYMKIEYDKGGNLYVLATQLDLIQKYAGSDAKKPKLNRLGGQEWTKTRTRVQKAVQEIAKELVELYAIRQSKEGFQFGEDTIWQREFEEMFPFEETEDQQTAIAATKADMESRKIMDRLICGDVGFGKTEIAIRAAFKAVQEGKQVVYLVPTTILAQQHYNTFAQRMKDFPVNVELLCRFRTAKQQKEAIEGLKKGLVDIVIGTHRVLSKDVQFKDLGLLIIDEEQRFGVTHKEKIKQMKKDVDVLTLTATPIPRTLHMSLIGIRDMSVLEEPPHDRMPIQTYVMEYNEEMIREAIHREIARGGQVYYVFNRVNQIADVAAKIAQLVPEADVAFAHGQMSERELERVMYSFINGEIDVLVSTTIIETGLDISNANTMIIHDADNLGLSQLYQLRGRIGRSNRTSYAFLMYRRNKMLKEVAEKRLSAIREFSELGSGFKIAMKDLEIRGAGNLLGEQQHGHMEAVGYDLYCKMLNEAVREVKGEVVEESFDTAIDIDVDAYIPNSYIANEYQKLDIYKRIATIGNEEEKDEMLDELIDRFGEPPRPVQNLLAIAQIKGDAHRVYLVEIKEKSDNVTFRLFEHAKVDATKIPWVLEQQKPLLTFVPDKQEPYFVYRKQKNSPDTMTVIRTLITNMKEILLPCDNPRNVV